MKTVRFRFQNLLIWQIAIELSDELLNIADDLEQLKLFRYSEQLRGAIMSVTNNIAEGSGSTTNADFANFLKFSRRSAFEVVNILIILNRRKRIDDERLDEYLEKLDELSRKIWNFRNSLLRGRKAES